MRSDRPAGVVAHVKIGEVPPPTPRGRDLTVRMPLPGLVGTSPAWLHVCQELERGDSALRGFVSVQSALCMYPIWAYGSDEQKKRYLPGMQRGELIACFGLTEHDHGSDPGGMDQRSDRSAWARRNALSSGRQRKAASKNAPPSRSNRPARSPPIAALTQ